MTLTPYARGHPLLISLLSDAEASLFLPFCLIMRIRCLEYQNETKRCVFSHFDNSMLRQVIINKETFNSIAYAFIGNAPFLLFGII